MSKYTTEVRYICETYAGLSHSANGNDVESVITQALPHIFNFSFPIFDENYRTILEKKIIKHYYTREIGYETVGLWKLKLNTKLNEIMPYYNKLYNSELIEFNPIYSTNLTKEHDLTREQNKGKKDNNTRTLNTVQSVEQDRDITIDDTGHDKPGDTTYVLHSDTPQGGLTGVDSETYLSDAQKTYRRGDNQTSNHHTDLGSIDTTTKDNGTIADVRAITENAKTVDDYLESIYGFQGYSPNKLLKEYRDNFLNIDLMIINDLSKLFMGLW